MHMLLSNQMCKRRCVCFCRANFGKSQGGIVSALDSMSGNAFARLQAACCQFFAHNFGAAILSLLIAGVASLQLDLNCSMSLRSHMAT